MTIFSYKKLVYHALFRRKNFQEMTVGGEKYASRQYMPIRLWSLTDVVTPVMLRVEAEVQSRLLPAQLSVKNSVYSCRVAEKI
jgi:hypothetical protein